MNESPTAATKRIEAELIERWPDVFNLKKPVPLEVGINAALMAAMPDCPNLTDGILRRTLARWCNRPYYLKALVAGADRHGLDGIQGSVTEEQAELAAEKMEALKAKINEKAKAKREARKAENARRTEAKKKKAALEAPKQAEEAKKTVPPPVPPQPDPTTPKTAGGPVIVVKKRRMMPLT